MTKITQTDGCYLTRSFPLHLEAKKFTVSENSYSETPTTFDRVRKCIKETVGKRIAKREE